MPSAVVDALFEVAPVFSGFSTADRKEMMGIAVEETYGPGAELLSEGEQARSMFVLAEGTVEVVESGRSGEPRSLATLIPPCTFGELAFFESADHFLTVRALTAVRVLSIERVGFDRLLGRQSLAAYKLALNVLINLGNRLRRLDRWVADEIAQADASKREQWDDFRARLYQEWEI